ncbi:MAG TPA: M1 family metallopeptidase [Nocardioides sp.]|uniref:M1 family metallopeptidase n=1 Tax=Nocardioides sp. TaxID=35761 RepID=UPI002E2FCC07|nr:M1 family metallopeptidase [Nocardioides sp.]HEX5086648.1 M1 family metallopeptidase [Nocardioides sp.]
MRLPRRLGALLLTTALGCGLLTACNDDSSGDAAQPAGSPTPARDVSLPDETKAPPDPDDPALDPALSRPVEDSLYPDVGDPSVDALRYDLDLAWSPDSRTLDGDAIIELRSTESGDHLQLDLGEPLEVSSVTLDGAEVEFQHVGKDLVVEAPVTKDERYVLDVAYSGTPQPTPAPTNRTDFSTTGWTITPDGETWTMQEPYGAFTWYPVNDQPSDKAYYDFTLTVPSPWIGIANGVMTAQKEYGGLTTTAWHLSKPASSYVVTVAMGDYTRTTNTTQSGLEISYWVPSDRPELASGLQAAAAGLDWLKNLLGPYPFDSLGFLLNDSRSGMETQTMISLGATDYTTSTAVLVHEMAHQWYGDEVTPQDWRDVWMNEGMAMYLQGCWEAAADGRTVDAVMDHYAELERKARAAAGPPAAYDPQQFGQGNIYYGPALMWHELRKKIGDDAFWKLVRAWPARAPETNATYDEYLDWLVNRTHVHRSFFDSWLLDPTTPPRS